jgi:hypothetical protein
MILAGGLIMINAIFLRSICYLGSDTLINLRHPEFLLTPNPLFEVDMKMGYEFEL